MPITNGLVTVGTSATLISGGGISPGEIHISNLDHAETLFVGGPTVAVNNGEAIFKTESEIFVIYPTSNFYGVSSKSDHLVSYMLITP